MAIKWLVGIDEAGRGPLAGPVAVGVFAIPNTEKLISKVRDSKKLTPKKREELFEELKLMKYAVAFSSSQYIDTYGIVPAIKQAMKKALRKLELNPRECEVFLDGSLIAPSEYVHQQTIIKGDDLIPVISAASICAKALRDQYMIKVSKKFPHHGFDIHKGYGTLSHRQAIKKHGLSPEHRQSFCRFILKNK